MADVVRIVHQDGRFATVPKENLAEAAKLGWRPEQEADRAERQKGTVLEAGHDAAVAGIVGGALAIPKLATAAGAAVLGTEDPLARFSGRQFVEDVKGVAGATQGQQMEVAAREAAERGRADAVAHPVAQFVGETGGSLLGLGGAAGLIGKAGTALGLAGRATAALDGAGLSARGAQIAAGLGASASEGAALGVQAGSEQAWIRDEKLTAAQTLAHAGLGALFGFGLSAGLQGAKAGVPSLARALGYGEERAAVEGAEAATERGALGTTEKAAPSVVERDGPTLAVKAKRWLNDAGDEAIVDAVARGNKGALRDLGRGSAPTAVEKQEAGALLHELGIGAVGRSETEMLNVIESKRAGLGSALDKIIADADTHVGTIKAEDLLPKLDALKEKLASGGRLAEDRAIPEWIDDQSRWLRDQLATDSLTPSKLHSFRIEVDQRLGKWTRAEPGPKADAARAFGRELEQHLRDEIAAKVSPEALAQYERTNKLYGAARWAVDTLEERVGVRNSANRILSPSDYLAGGTALLSSGGNPLVAAASAIGNKALRERGMSTFAVLAKKAAGEAIDLSAVPAASVNTARALQGAVASSEQRISEGVERFFSGAKRARGAAVARAGADQVVAAWDNTRAGRREYAAHAQAVREAATNPETLASRANDVVGHELAAAAPSLHTAMATKMALAAAYLDSKKPAPASDPRSITPHLDDPPPVSPMDMQIYRNRLMGIINPLSLIDDLNSNNVSPEKVEAVKTVWPEVFASMQRSVALQVSQLTTPLDHEKRQRLDMFLDANGAVEPSMRPSNLSIMRAVRKRAEQAQPPPQNRPVPDVSKSFATTSQQIAMR